MTNVRFTYNADLNRFEMVYTLNDGAIALLWWDGTHIAYDFKAVNEVWVNIWKSNIGRKGYTNTYAPNGLTVTAIIQGSSVGISIRGNVAQILGTSTTYAACGAIPQLIPLMSRSLIKRVILFGTCQGQLYVEKDTGLVKIGNTRLLTTGEPCDIPAGVQIYVDEGFVV